MRDDVLRPLQVAGHRGGEDRAPQRGHEGAAGIGVADVGLVADPRTVGVDLIKTRAAADGPRIEARVKDAETVVTPAAEVAVAYGGEFVAVGAGGERRAAERGERGPLAQRRARGVGRKIGREIGMEKLRAERRKRAVDAVVVAIAELEREVAVRGQIHGDALGLVDPVLARDHTGERVLVAERDQIVQPFGTAKAGDVGGRLIVHGDPVVEHEARRRAEGRAARNNRGALVAAVFGKNTDPPVGPEGERGLQAVLIEPEDRAVVAVRVFEDVEADGEVARADVEVAGVGVRTLRIELGAQRGGALVNAGALAVDHDDTAGVARAVEEVVGAVDGLRALDVEAVEAGGGRAEKSIAPRLADGEAAGIVGAGLRGVALLHAALVLITAPEEHRAEATVIGEQAEHISAAELVHHRAGEHPGIDRRLVQGRADAREGIGVGGLVGVVGVAGHFERGQHQGVGRGGRGGGFGGQRLGGKGQRREESGGKPEQQGSFHSDGGKRWVVGARRAI